MPKLIIDDAACQSRAVQTSSKTSFRILLLLIIAIYLPIIII